MQKSKMAAGEALQIDVKRREVKSKGEKERYKRLNDITNTILYSNYILVNLFFKV